MKTLLVLTVMVFGFLAWAKADVVIIDVRSPEEYASDHVKGAQNINVQADDFTDKISKLDKSKSYKLYCRSGRRSGVALEKMKALGFKDVENMGGVDEAKAKLAKEAEAKK